MNLQHCGIGRIRVVLLVHYTGLVLLKRSGLDGCQSMKRLVGWLAG